MRIRLSLRSFIAMHDIMSDTALIQAERGQNATDIHLVNEAGFAEWAKKLSDVQRAMLEAQRFTGKGYETAIVPAKPAWLRKNEARSNFANDQMYVNTWKKATPEKKLTFYSPCLPEPSTESFSLCSILLAAIIHYVTM